MPFDRADFQEVVTETELQPWQRDLMRAAAVVRERGLNQNGAWICPDGAVCAVAAIGIAQGRFSGMGDWHHAHTEAAVISDAAKKLREHVGRSLPGWSDSTGQTAENVASTMEAVALNGSR